MEKPRFILFLPPGTLAEMRPFRRWLAEQPTYRVVSADAAESCDVVEFNTCLSPCYLMRTLAHLVTPHAPYHLFLNLPVPERRTGARYIHATERGVLARGAQWRVIEQVSLEQWIESVAALGGRRQFALHEILFSGSVPCERTIKDFCCDRPRIDF